MEQQAVAEKTWPHVETPAVAGIITKLLDFVKRQIPEGYQDETGFHYGTKPAEEHPCWPPA